MLVLAVLLSAAAPTANCLDVHNGAGLVSLEGRLDRRVFVTPDVGDGRPERDYILILRRPICIDDGGDFADPNRRFVQVQLYSGTGALWPRLRAAVGHQVRVAGIGFAAQTAHHHAPLVVDVSSVRIRR